MFFSIDVSYNDENEYINNINNDKDINNLKLVLKLKNYNVYENIKICR